jgi:hypothetical protein
MYCYLIDFYPAGRKETAANTQSIKQSINRPINLHFLTTTIKKKLAGRFSSMIYMDIVTGGRNCLVNSNKQTLQLTFIFSYYVGELSQ